MRIEILCTGDELLTGLTVDTNSPYFLAKLFALGEKLAWSTTVGDVREDLIEAIRTLSARADAVLVSGGLGPTADDLTVECAAAAAGVGVVENKAALESLTSRFAKRGLTLTPNNTRQALVPVGAEAVINPVGSAPMIIQRIGRCTFYFVPGVPREYKALVDTEVLPRLRKQIEAQPHRIFRAFRLLKTVGLAESHLDAMVAPLAKVHPKVVFGFRTHAPENHLKLMAEAGSQREADSALAASESACREVLGAFVFGLDEEAFPEVVVKALAKRKQTLAAAESCTGGLLAELVTAVPGASEVFLGSAVVYAEKMKSQWVGVPAELISRDGAVSPAVAGALASGARAACGATYGLGVTGYAGPGAGGEGTKAEPVGTVYLGLATPSGVHVERFVFGGDRERVRQFAAYYALDMLRRSVLGVPLRP